MRHASVLGLLAVLSVTPAWAGPKKPPPPPPGVRWESSLAGALERSKREGRPLLVCINALENQVPQLVTDLYPSEAWGRATRGYVSVVANPNVHAEKDGACARFGQIPCGCHQEVLSWALRRFAPDGNLISPQHLILEPDGAVAYRVEYYQGEPGPFELDTYLSRLAPDLAVRLAGIERAGRTTEIVKAPVEKAAELARAWLGATEDGLATAGLLSALFDVEAAPKRLALIEAFAAAPAYQAPVLVPTLEGITFAPDEKPEECVRWVSAALAVDRPIGAWAAGRALVRATSAALRERVVQAWTGTKDGSGAGALAAGERAALAEALELAGAKVPAAARVDDGEGTEAVPPLRRARARARGATGATPLPPVLTALAPRDLRRALLAASADGVAAREADVTAILRQAPFARVRVAAAVALFRARRAAAGAVAQALLDALADPLEGPDTRALLAPPKDEDPADDPEAWRAWIHARLEAPR